MQATVDVEPVADAHWLEEAGDGAGGGDRLGQRRRGRILAPEHHPFAGLVVAGHDPGVGMRDPTVRIRLLHALFDAALDGLGRDQPLRRQSAQRFQDADPRSVAEPAHRQAQ